MKKQTYIQSLSLRIAIRNFILVMIPLNFGSCEKFVAVEPPKTQLTTTVVFQNEATANATMNTLYAKSVTFVNGSYNSASLLGAESSDETECWSTNLSVQQVFDAQLIPSNSYSTALWKTCYEVIYIANSILEGVQENHYLTEEVIARLKGEALFFRALAHLTLTNFFGGVPLVISTKYLTNTRLSQTSPAELLSTVVSDLKTAKPLLPTDYVLTAGERVRVNRYAISALLARAYLYQGDWLSAEREASETIAASGLFSLPALSQTFLKNSSETILSYKPFSINQNTGDGNVYILTGKPTYIALRRSFVESFAPNDQRKTAWIGKVTSGGVDYFYPSKYKVKNSPVVSEYSILLRLAEQYLIRAEARARMDQLSLAISDLDKVRLRAGLSKLAITNPLIDRVGLLNQILTERKSELFTEWGHRWIDLKRFGQLSETLSPIKPGFVATAVLYPIPQSEININPNLKQNPGY